MNEESIAAEFSVKNVKLRNVDASIFYKRMDLLSEPDKLNRAISGGINKCNSDNPVYMECVAPHINMSRKT